MRPTLELPSAQERGERGMNQRRAGPSLFCDPLGGRRRRRLGGHYELRTVTLGHFLSLGGILFALSVVGIFLNRRNLIVLLMAIELMLLAVNLNFIAFRTSSATWPDSVRVLHPHRRRGRVGHRPGDPGGAVRNRATINVDELDALKG